MCVQGCPYIQHTSSLDRTIQKYKLICPCEYSNISPCKYYYFHRADICMVKCSTLYLKLICKSNLTHFPVFDWTEVLHAYLNRIIIYFYGYFPIAYTIFDIFKISIKITFLGTSFYYTREYRLLALWQIDFVFI